MFHPYEPDQAHLFPPSPRDWLPATHLVHFISDTIDQLDIRSIVKSYRDTGTGNLAYHPRLMLKLLVYGYCTGVFASRKVAIHIEENVAFRYLAAGHSPSHRTICRFRQDHLNAFKDLFVQVVQIAGAAGLTKMGTLAVDGTKMKANASKHSAMSYGRMQKEEKRLKHEIAELTKAAQEADEIDDERFGPHFRGDELPAELQRREDRLRCIQEAKQRLEARKSEEDAPKAEAEKRILAQGQRKRGRPRKHPLGEPKPSDQENFTDPDSRIMKDGSGAFQQCYNAQIAVDGKKQIIVSSDVVQSAADNHQLVPMVEAAIAITVAAFGLPIPKLIIEMPSAVAVGMGRSTSATVVSIISQNRSRYPPKFVRSTYEANWSAATPVYRGSQFPTISAFDFIAPVPDRAES